VTQPPPPGNLGERCGYLPASAWGDSRVAWLRAERSSAAAGDHL